MQAVQSTARHVQISVDNPSLGDPGINIVRAPLVTANAAVLEGYGHLVTSFEDAEVEIVTWPQPGWRKVRPGSGNEGGITQGTFEFFRQGELMRAKNHAVDGDYITGWFADPASASDTAPASDVSRIIVREANYHPDGGQIFFPASGSAYVALLAKPGDDVRPEDFRAFLIDGEHGVHIDPGVWHQPVFPLAERATFDDKQGRVHACIEVDFINEFNCYVEVPLPRP